MTDPLPPTHKHMGKLAHVPAAELRGRYNRGESIRQIAHAYRCSTTAVQTAFDRHGIQRRPRGSGRQPLTEDIANDIISRYRAGGHVPAIAAELNLPRTIVRGAIPADIVRPRRPVSETSITPQQLRAEYDTGLGLSALAEIHDLTTRSVYIALQQAGTDMRPPSRHSTTGPSHPMQPASPTSGTPMNPNTSDEQVSNMAPK